MLKKTIILNKSHVEELIKMNEVIQSVETAFREEANCNIDMPAKKYLILQPEHSKKSGRSENYALFSDWKHSRCESR